MSLLSKVKEFSSKIADYVSDNRVELPLFAATASGLALAAAPVLQIEHMITAQQLLTTWTTGVAVGFASLAAATAGIIFKKKEEYGAFETPPNNGLINRMTRNKDEGILMNGNAIPSLLKKDEEKPTRNNDFTHSSFDR